MHTQNELGYDYVINEIQDYAIILLDKSGNIQNWNKGAEKIKGYLYEEVKGRSFRIFYSPEDKKCNLPGRILEEARKNGRAQHEGWRVRKDGTKFWGYVVITALHDLNGNVSGFIKITRDLTERKIAEMKIVENEQKFRSIFNSTFQFIGLLRKDGIVIEANQKALDFANTTIDNIAGIPFWECCWWQGSKKMQQRIRHAVVEAAKGKFVRFKTEMLGPNNHFATIDFSLNPILNNEGQVVMMVPECRDITELESLQEQLRKLQERRRIEVIKSIVEAQERERAAVSYELHDNVNQILATCRLLIEMCKNETASNIALYVDKAYGYLNTAIEEVRSISKNLNPGSLKEIGLTAAINDLTNVISSTGKIKAIISYSKSFDECRLGKDLKLGLFRIIQEQISNTLRHSQASNIRLRFSQKDNKLLYVYTDNGIGLKLVYKQGLGMRNIFHRVELFHGEAQIHSTEGKGFSMRVKIPLVEIPAANRLD